MVPEAFPDYGKSIVTQLRGDPETAGAIRGMGTGAVGAVLGALGARLAEQERERVVLAAILGGLIGGIPGFVSGKRERESLNTKLLSLRRLGIQTPGELEAAGKYPGLAKTIIEPGVQV
jgi:hypothetical protein